MSLSDVPNHVLILIAQRCHWSCQWALRVCGHRALMAAAQDPRVVIAWRVQQYHAQTDADALDADQPMYILAKQGRVFANASGNDLVGALPPAVRGTDQLRALQALYHCLAVNGSWNGCCRELIHVLQVGNSSLPAPMYWLMACLAAGISDASAMQIMILMVQTLIRVLDTRGNSPTGLAAVEQALAIIGCLSAEASIYFIEGIVPLLRASYASDGTKSKVLACISCVSRHHPGILASIQPLLRDQLKGAEHGFMALVLAAVSADVIAGSAFIMPILTRLTDPQASPPEPLCMCKYLRFLQSMAPYMVVDDPSFAMVVNVARSTLDGVHRNLADPLENTSAFASACAILRSYIPFVTQLPCDAVPSEEIPLMPSCAQAVVSVLRSACAFAVRTNCTEAERDDIPDVQPLQPRRDVAAATLNASVSCFHAVLMSLETGSGARHARVWMDALTEPLLDQWARINVEVAALRVHYVALCGGGGGSSGVQQ